MRTRIHVAITLFFLLAVALSACGQPTPAPAKAPVKAPAAAPAQPTAAKPVEAAPTKALAAAATAAPLPTVAASKYKEAPALAELAKSGKLPAVADRLPQSPMVVKPTEKVGVYGGTWRMGTLGGNDSLSFQRVFAYEPLLRWMPDFSGYLPNVAESFTPNADSTEYTVKLRKGMKWSNGKPFTTADVKFWYEDVLLNTEITAKPDIVFTSGGKVVEVKIIDDSTFTFKFAGPYGFFPLRMSNNAAPISYPAEYLKQFHTKYNPDAAKNATAAGAKSWVEYFTQKATYYVNIELPTLYAWNLATAYGSNSSVLSVERNPYYWKVDTEGNQLPYIDKLQYTIHQNLDTLTLQALNGEIDMQYRHFGTLNNKPIFFENQAKGNFKLVPVTSALANGVCIYPTLTTKDPTVRALLNNKDFRIGLSYAINRKEFIDLIFFGPGHPATGGAGYQRPVCQQADGLPVYRV